MNTLALATANDHVGVNAVALTVLIALFTLVTVMGFMASKWRPLRHGEPGRMGSRRSQLRDLGHLVPARR